GSGIVVLMLNMAMFGPLFFFFFQAEDGIRDGHVTGVQTCALPIYFDYARRVEIRREDELGELARAFNQMASTVHASQQSLEQIEIGRASCRERVSIRVVARALKKKSHSKRRVTYLSVISPRAT